MVLADLPRFHDPEYMYFSTRRWPRLLGGYSGYIPFNADLEDGLGRFPTAAGIASLKRAGATHLTYNCALELSAARCERVLAILEDSPQLELVAGGRWERADVRLYRLK
jgi:hypothetical protein